MRNVKTTAYLLTGDTVDDEIEWDVDALVSFTDPRDPMDTDEVEFGEVRGEHTSLAGGKIEPMSFDEWREQSGITQAQVDRLEQSAFDHARDYLAGLAYAEADAAYDRRREQA